MMILLSSGYQCQFPMSKQYFKCLDIPISLRYNYPNKWPKILWGWTRETITIYTCSSMWQGPSFWEPLQSMCPRSIKWLRCGNWLRNCDVIGWQTLASWSSILDFFLLIQTNKTSVGCLSILPLRTPLSVNHFRNRVGQVPGVTITQL